MYKYWGQIKTEDNFMYVLCDPDLAKYYRKLASYESIQLISQRRDSHISVIRPEELFPGQILDKRFEDREIEFFGNPEYMNHNKTHYWFRVISPDLEAIRLDMGFTYQPVENRDGELISHPLHFTIGRIK